MFLFLTVVQAIVAAGLVGVILMQRSEGGGLGVGGNPSGMMSARGAADVLTRATTILAILFVSLSVALAVLAASDSRSSSIDQSLERESDASAAPVAEEPAIEEDAVPLSGEGAGAIAAPQTDNGASADIIPNITGEQPVNGDAGTEEP